MSTQRVAIWRQCRRNIVELRHEARLYRGAPAHRASGRDQPPGNETCEKWHLVRALARVLARQLGRAATWWNCAAPRSARSARRARAATLEMLEAAAGRRPAAAGLGCKAGAAARYRHPRSEIKHSAWQLVLCFMALRRRSRLTAPKRSAGVAVALGRVEAACSPQRLENLGLALGTNGWARRCRTDVCRVWVEFRRGALQADGPPG